MNGNTQKKHILFLELSENKSNVFSHSIKHPLLGPLWMATKVKEAGHHVTVIKENLCDRERIRLEMKVTDILILTMLTPLANRSKEIAIEFKENYPMKKVIVGGVHASLNPEECLEYADQVVVGEGVRIILDLVDEKITDRLVYAPAVETLDEHPIIDFNLLVNSSQLKMIPVITSLGCPFNCTFCCVTKLYGREYRFQSTEKTIKEIKEYFRQLGKKNVFFFDDNLCANKNRASQLFDEIIKENFNVMWCCQVRADLAHDEEIVKKMALSGCRRVYIGFESISNETLIDVHKNETLNDIENAIRVFHLYGIAIYGMFMFSPETDDIDVFKKTVDFCKKFDIDAAHFLIMTPLPGTEYYDSLDKNRFLTTNWDYFDGFHITLKPKNMTSNELMQGLILSYKKMYSPLKLFNQLIYDIKDIFANSYRTKRYLLLKLTNNFSKAVRFRIMIWIWVKQNKTYLSTLNDLRG